MANICAVPNVPVIEIDGRPWFVASAACIEMGYKNPTDIIKRHVKPEHCRKIKIHTGSRGNSNRVVIDEVGLYSLMAGAVRKDKAASFKHWLTEQVLPNYRKGNLPSVQQASRVLTTENDLKMQKALTILRNEVLAVRQEQMQARQEMTDILKQIRGYFQLSPKNWRRAAVSVVKEAAHREHSQQFRDYYNEMYSEFEADTGVRLKIRLKNMQSKNPKIKSVLDVIASDKKLIKGFIPVIGGFAMRHGIALDIEKDIEKVA